MSSLASPSSDHFTFSGRASVEAAVIRTVAYGDIFDFPVTTAEVHRYLVGVRATSGQVAAAIETLVPGRLGRVGDYVFLPGRRDLVRIRLRRHERAKALWPRAREYAAGISSLPFVRMVAVTGSLARSSVDEHADVDLLIVTDPDRLWLSRAMVGLLTRHAARRGVTLCANYFLSDDALALEERDVYTAHELLQMVPLAGLSTYRRLRQENLWVRDHFPNADDTNPPPPHPATGSHGDPVEGVLLPRWIRRLLEGLLRLPPGAWLDGLERRRKLRKSRQQGRDLTEARFDRSCFKGHFDGHGRRSLAAYEARLRTLEKGAP